MPKWYTREPLVLPQKKCREYLIRVQNLDYNVDPSVGEKIKIGGWNPGVLGLEIKNEKG